MFTPNPTDEAAVLAMTFPGVRFLNVKSGNWIPFEAEGLQRTHVVPFSGEPGNTCDVQSSAGAVKRDVTIAQAGTAGLAKAAAVDSEPISKTILGLAALVFGPIMGIFTHHAQAVVIEKQTLCGIVPEVNAAFDQLDSAVEAGQVTVTDADTALDGILTKYEAGVSAIMNRGQCNAACQVDGLVQQQIALRKRAYSSLAPPGGLAGILRNIGPSLKKYWYLWLMAAAIIILFRKVEG